MTSDVASVTAGSAPAAPPTSRTRRTGGSSLGRYILIRFLLMIPTVLILVTVVFFLIRLTGDPITAALGGQLTPDQLAERIHAAGYDRPVLVQYFEYLGQIFTLDFGTTLTGDRRPVTDVILTYGSATLELVVYALIVAFIVGIPLGMVAAAKRDRWPDAGLRVSAILFYATPVFFSGLVAKLIFSVWLGWLPVSGRANVRTEIALGREGGTGIYLIDAIASGNSAYVQDVLLHAILPAVTLGLLTAGIFLRLVRTNLIGTYNMPYIDAARSRGVGEGRLVRTHAYRPALIPIITVIGLQIALMLGGAVLTETTFEWKGLGFQLAAYLSARDFVAVQGIVAMIAVIVAVTNFLVDIIAAFVDPRVRY